MTGACCETLRAIAATRSIPRGEPAFGSSGFRVKPVRQLRPRATPGLEKLSPIVWSGDGDEALFEFAIDPAAGSFLCFFLQGPSASVAPKLSFDEGDGFNDVSILVLKSFPFAFYHVSLDRMRDLRRLRFRPCSGPATFRFLAFQTSNSLLVAICHFLFNLRYQNIGLVATDAKGRGGRLARIRGTIERIAKFFRDVSKGGGVTVQEGTNQDLLPVLSRAMSFKALDVQHRMAERLVGLETPLVSFVCPTFETPVDFLRDLLGSFSNQGAAYVELVLSDDGSKRPETIAFLQEAGRSAGVRVVFNAVNRGIAAATNTGLEAAAGTWVSFIDHDDLFVESAVAVIAATIEDNPDARFFYTDELIVDASLKPIGAFCKPAFDAVLLSGVNYINHFSVFRRDRVLALGGLRLDREGSQDYDLLLRYLDGASPGSIIHIPFPAYMWRRTDQTYSTKHRDRAVASARRGLIAAYAAGGTTVEVEPALDPSLHRVRFPSTTPRPLVSIIIPNLESLGLIRRVVADLRDKTDYKPFEIVIVDNGTTDQAVLAFYATLNEGAVTVDIVPEPFNFARMCNRGARLAKGEAFLFLNNDVEVEGSDWLAEMVECLSFESAGIVGAKLVYPSGRLQHAGVIVGLGEAAGHWYGEAQADEPGPMGRLFVRQTLSAVTGACMLVTRRCFEALGGFDEERFPIAYNDIDLCLRARAAGFRTIWTPFARLIHHESLTRGSDEEGPRQVRFEIEKERLRDRHQTRTIVDDAYSPFYDRRTSTAVITVPESIPAPRPNLFR